MENNKNNESKSSVGLLKKRLYSRNSKQVRRVKPLSERDYGAKGEWTDTVKEAKKPRGKTFSKFKNLSIFPKMLIVAVVFFILSLGTAFFIFYGGMNIVSSQNVEISIAGPVSVGGGENLSLQITIINNNSVDLEMADLIIEYPEGTRSSVNRTKVLSRIRESLGTVPAGGSVSRLVQSVLFGEESTQKKMDITVEYRTAGSNAIFFKEKEYSIVLSSSPIGVIVNYPSEVISGEEIEFEVEIISNSSSLVEDTLLKAEYPFGFEFKQSDPKPTAGNHTWKIGDLKPETSQVIKIRGIVTGQDEEERIFRFFSGISNDKDKESLGTAFASALETVLIKKPFIGLDFTLNGDKSSEYVSQSGQSVRVDALWENNYSDKILDGVIEVKLTGEILNKSSVVTNKGFYRSFSNTIVWDKVKNSELGVINPGDSGRVSFSFSSLSNTQIEDPFMGIEITIKGRRASGNIADEISTSKSKIVKISSNLLFTPRIVYTTGPFVNTGQLPPMVDKETTYTIIWTIMNTSNDLSGVEVTANLPPYIKWANNISPTNEDLTFNPSGGKVTWKIGDVDAGTGNTKSAKEVAFQVIFRPSLSQVGTSPRIIDNLVAEGKDRFTGATIKRIKNALTSKLGTDLGFIFGDEIVVIEQL